MSYSKGYLSAIENGRTIVHEELIRKYEKELELKPGELSELPSTKSEDHIKDNLSNVVGTSLNTRQSSYQMQLESLQQQQKNIIDARQSLQVMIVDEYEIVRHGLREVINSIPRFIVVAEASTCRDALSQLQYTAIDLVFTELFLPDGDGMELVHILRRSDVPPYIIILSATINDDLLLEAMLAGASGYLTKDVPAAEIARLLQGFHRGDLVLTSPVASRLINLLVQMATKGGAIPPTPPHQQLPDGRPIDNLPETALSPLSRLTPQEEKIFQLMRLGLSNKQIASQLVISRFTVGKHVQNILRKLGVTNRTQAASYTVLEGVESL